MFKRKWNEELITAHIYSRRKSEPLNAYYYATNYPDLYAAAQRIFGSWRHAIEACGIDYLKVKKYRQWSKTRVVEEIKALAKKREALNSIFVQRKRKPLYMAAIKRFKSWEGAMRAAGVDYSKIRLRRRLSKAELKAEVLKLWESRFDLAYPNMRSKRQWLLASAMKKLGAGSWDKARKSCGIKFNFRLKGEKRVVALAKAQGVEPKLPKKTAKKSLLKKTLVKKISAKPARKAVVKKPLKKLVAKPAKKIAVKKAAKSAPKRKASKRK